MLGLVYNFFTEMVMGFMMPFFAIFLLPAFIHILLSVYILLARRHWHQICLLTPTGAYMKSKTLCRCTNTTEFWGYEDFVNIHTRKDNEVLGTVFFAQRWVWVNNGQFYSQRRVSVGFEHIVKYKEVEAIILENSRRTTVIVAQVPAVAIPYPVNPNAPPGFAFAYPVQGYPPQAYPPQNYPPQNYPQNYTTQNYPPQHYTQNYPQGAFPLQSYPPAASEGGFQSPPPPPPEGHPPVYPPGFLPQDSSEQQLLANKKTDQVD